MTNKLCFKHLNAAATLVLCKKKTIKKLWSQFPNATWFTIFTSHVL